MTRIDQLIENKDRISSAFNQVLHEGFVHFFCLNTKETEPKKNSIVNGQFTLIVENTIIKNIL